MQSFSQISADSQPMSIRYCDRCARRATTLLFDDLTLQDLCQDCLDQLKRRRDLIPYPAKPRT